MFVCLSVCLSGVSVRGVNAMGGRSAMLRTNLRGRGSDKNPGSTYRYTNFGQFIIRIIIKILPPDVTF